MLVTSQRHVSHLQKMFQLPQNINVYIIPPVYLIGGEIQVAEMRQASKIYPAVLYCHTIDVYGPTEFHDQNLFLRATAECQKNLFLADQS